MHYVLYVVLSFYVFLIESLSFGDKDWISPSSQDNRGELRYKVDTGLHSCCSLKTVSKK